MKHSRHNIAAPSSLARLAVAGTFVITASVAVALEPHIATQAQDRPSPLAACLVYAGEATLLLDGQKVELCAGATTPPTAPVDCFRAATGTLFLSDPQSIALCHSAVSTAPVECVRRVRRAGTVADPQAVTQCVGAR